MDYRPDGELFATAGRDCKVRVYEENTKVLLTTMSEGNGTKCCGHSNRVYAVKFKPNDPNILLSGGWDNTIQIWDVRTGQSVRSIYGPHICGELLMFSLFLSLSSLTLCYPGDALDVYNDDILTGSWKPDNALQVWDYGSGKVKRTLRVSSGSNPEMLYAASFSSDGHYIVAGGSGSNEARVFESQSGRPLDIASYKTPVFATTFAPNSRSLAIGGSSPDISILHDL